MTFWNIFSIFFRKIRLHFHVNGLPSRLFTWNVKFYLFWKSNKRKLDLLSSTVLLGILLQFDLIRLCCLSANSTAFNNSVFRENRCPPPIPSSPPPPPTPTPPPPPPCELSVFLLLWPYKLGQGHQNLISSLLCPNYISMKIWYESTAGSYDMQARKCEAKAYANTDADAHANRISTKITMSSSP